jgi:alanyl-tRNA synthetase
VQAGSIETRSFHLGQETSTIDVDPRVSDDVAIRAVALANDVVFADRPLRVHVVDGDDPAALERFQLRRQTFHGARVRLIEIEGFDVSTCGGTHAHRTGEVGLIAIKSIEKAKGLHRVEFVCGGRALREYQADRAIVQETARLLSTGADAIAAQVRRLVEQATAQRKRIAQLFALAAGGQAEQLVARARPFGDARIVSEVLGDLAFEEAQVLAKKVVECGSVVALFGVADAAAPKLLFARSSEASLATLAIGPLVKRAAECFGGRGGGSANAGQASVARPEDLPAALAFAEELVREGRAAAAS